MKTISVRELQKCIKECVDHAQKSCVVVTRHGRPSAILIGVEGKDWEELVTHTAPELARHIPVALHSKRSKPGPPEQAPQAPPQEQQPPEFLAKVRRFFPGL